ncbi:hypothetical protein GLAREA_05694 [Glarea lozoyensis ATCC 20868]|uniref:Uncharacterized protein n=1 Tax=Glarea lozoyensis (strain ATCC 20868 / MF5171) TaxID=1116229 RepID=S3DWP6_GLAL2|nr:uncharacterized protein GLAREA_05694 [Glarea lozoyensis ATCC 20868]EPE36356.1 hypothetical protein GLAREA_05694 [Glarea lozoyensis ATCC 20868]
MIYSQDKAAYKNEFLEFLKTDIIDSWFQNGPKLFYNYGKTRQISSTRTARFKIETDSLRDPGWLNVQVLDYEYEEVDVENGFFPGFEEEISRRVRAEIWAPYPNPNKCVRWIYDENLKAAFLRSFENMWPLGYSREQLVLRMDPRQAVDRIRSTDLGETPKRILEGGFEIRTTVFRRVEGVLEGSVKVLELPVRDVDGKLPKEVVVVEWDASEDRTALDGNLNERVVEGLRIKLSLRRLMTKNRLEVEKE